MEKIDVEFNGFRLVVEVEFEEDNNRDVGCGNSGEIAFWQVFSIDGMTEGPKFDYIVGLFESDPDLDEVVYDYFEA